MEHLTFAKATLQAPALPEPGKRLTNCDTETPKRALRATAAGTKTVHVITRTGHSVEPKKAVERAMARAGILCGRDVPNGITLHDLRRTQGSWQARTGASRAIIGKSLNHRFPQATAIHARLDLDPVRQSVNTATSAMLEAAGLKSAAAVVTLATKRSAA